MEKNKEKKKKKVQIKTRTDEPTFSTWFQIDFWGFLSRPSVVRPMQPF